MDFNYSKEQQIIASITARFAKKEIEPHIDFIEEQGHMPEGFHKKLGDVGLIGISLPEEYGGTGLPFEALMTAEIELAKTCPAATTTLIASLACAEIISLHGTDEQKKCHLPSLASGDLVGGMAFTEPGTGSDPRQMTTAFREDGDSVVINGVKRFISNAAYPGPLVVYANSVETGECSAFIINKQCPGYSLSTPWEKIGMKGSPVYDVFLDDVRVPIINMLGTKGNGFNVLLSESSMGKLSHAAIAVGIMERAKELAIAYTTEKMHRGKPITKFQAIQLKLTKICERLESVRWMVYRCAALAQAGTDDAEFKAYAALVKGYASDLVPEVALMAMNVMGACGPMREYSIERYLRDALIEPHIEVVSDVQRVIYASYLTR